MRPAVHGRALGRMVCRNDAPRNDEPATCRVTGQRGCGRCGMLVRRGDDASLRRGHPERRLGFAARCRLDSTHSRLLWGRHLRRNLITVFAHVNTPGDFFSCHVPGRRAAATALRCACTARAARRTRCVHAPCARKPHENKCDAQHAWVRCRCARRARRAPRQVRGGAPGFRTHAECASPAGRIYRGAQPDLRGICADARRPCGHAHGPETTPPAQGGRCSNVASPMPGARASLSARRPRAAPRMRRGRAGR